MTAIVSRLLALPTWLALTVIFGLAALETSVFLGLLIPGETALVLGGVLAGSHTLPMVAAAGVGVLGAIVSGTRSLLRRQRRGQRVLDSTLGRFVKQERLSRARDYVAARGGRAVLLGRFTAALRALLPGLPGMAGTPYRTFLPSNVAGGVVWGSAAVLLGYVAGASWRTALHLACGAGLAVLGAVVVSVVVGVVIRHARERCTTAAASAAREAEDEARDEPVLVGAGVGEDHVTTH